MRRIIISNNLTLGACSSRALAVDNSLRQYTRHMTNGHTLNGHRKCSHHQSSTTQSHQQDEQGIDSLEQAWSIIKELKAELRQKNSLIEALMQKHNLEGVKLDSTEGATRLNSSEQQKEQVKIEEKKNIVQNGTELLAAFEDGYGVIHLDNRAKGNTFDLGTTPVRMQEGGRVELYLLDDEAEAVTVRGAFILRKNSHLGIHGGTKRKIKIEAVIERKPVLDAGEKSSLQLEGVSIAGGRDGIYLCGQAVATVEMCSVANCVRGIFEMHRSQATICGTDFLDNIFHTVLLNKKLQVHSDLKNVGQSGASSGITPVRKRVASLVADRWECNETSSSDTSNGGKLMTGGANTFCGGRGDVVTMYNPMSDEYLEVYSTGGQEVKEVKLDHEERTANLADPVHR